MCFYLYCFANARGRLLRLARRPRSWSCPTFQFDTCNHVFLRHITELFLNPVVRHPPEPGTSQRQCNPWLSHSETPAAIAHITASNSPSMIIKHFTPRANGDLGIFAYKLTLPINTNDPTNQ